MGVSLRPTDGRTTTLIAVGGDLEPATLVNAYRRGIFPMEVTALQRQARLVVARAARHRARSTASGHEVDAAEREAIRGSRRHAASST